MSTNGLAAPRKCISYAFLATPGCLSFPLRGPSGRGLPARRRHRTPPRNRPRLALPNISDQKQKLGQPDLQTPVIVSPCSPPEANKSRTFSPGRLRSRRNFGECDLGGRRRRRRCERAADTGGDPRLPIQSPRWGSRQPSTHVKHVENTSQIVARRIFRRGWDQPAAARRGRGADDARNLSSSAGGRAGEMR